MRTLGFDPGVNGGWGVIDSKRFVACGRLPIIQVGAAKVIDVPAVVEIINTHAVELVVLELVGGRARQSASRSFTFGAAWGALLGAAQASGRRVQLVTPQRWKIDLGLIGTSKKSSIALAKHLYPGAGPALRKADSHDIAEGLLIAHWHALTTSGKGRTGAAHPTAAIVLEDDQDDLTYLEEVH